MGKMLSPSSLNVNQKSCPTLVLFPGSLGDMVCVLPAIASLSRREAERIVVAARGEALELCSLCSFVENTMSLEGWPFSQLFLDSRQIEEATRNFFLSFTAIFSWYGHTQGKVTENLLSLSQGKLWTSRFFTGQEQCHAVSYYLRCVNEKTLRCSSFRFSQQTLMWGESFWQKQRWGESSQILVLHPGSGGRGKRWASEGFRKVAQWWNTNHDGKTLILLGPAEEDECEEWRTIGEVVTNLSLAQVAVLLSRATLYLGNDSGVSHLAGMVGARGIVLFGPTQPQQWRPLGGNLSVIQNPVYREAFPNKEGISLDEISVEKVIASLDLWVRRADLSFR